MVGASESARISHAGCAGGGREAGAVTGYSGGSGIVAGERLVAQGGDGVLPSTQCRFSTRHPAVIPGRAPARTRNPSHCWIPDRLATLGVRNDELGIRKGAISMATRK